MDMSAICWTQHNPTHQMTEICVATQSTHTDHTEISTDMSEIIRENIKIFDTDRWHTVGPIVSAMFLPLGMCSVCIGFMFLPCVLV